MKEQIQKYLEQLQNKIKRTKYRLTEQSVIIRNQQSIHLDAVLLANANPLAVFEFKNTISALNKPEALNSYERLQTDCPFFIITDGLHSKIYETAKWTLKTAQNVDELLAIITTQPSSKEIEELKIKIHQEFQKESSAFKKELKATEKLFNAADFTSKLQNIFAAVAFLEDGFSANLKYDPDGRFFHITEDLRDFKELENIFFKTIIEEVPKGTEIHRYGTLDNVLRTIEGKTLRLSGIVGMNDISEIGYVDGYLDKQFKPMATDDHVNSINKKYIMCSSTLQDELMQWRLYGDDCKGACLVFEVNKGPKIPGLLLRKINYGIQRNGENYHPELDFILRTKDRLRKELKIDFRFKTLSLWRHFFKSYEYEPEKEVRLLLIGNENDEIKGEKFSTGSGRPIEIKWNLTNSHQILAPFIILSIDDSRLSCTLKRVVLGSKCPELAINLKQFSLLARKKNLSHIEVIPSKIINYR